MKKIFVYTGWGGQSWTKTIFFSMYRPSCLMEAFIRSKKYWFVWAGPLANHLFNFNFTLLSDGLTVAAERVACFADMDRCRATIFEWGVAWTIAYKCVGYWSPPNSSPVNMVARKKQSTIHCPTLYTEKINLIIKFCFIMILGIICFEYQPEDPQH